MKTKSLSTRLKEAGTVADIVKLIKEGDLYQFASNTTRRRWQRIATVRWKEVA